LCSGRQEDAWLLLVLFFWNNTSSPPTDSGDSPALLLLRRSVLESSSCMVTINKRTSRITPPRKPRNDNRGNLLVGTSNSDGVMATSARFLHNTLSTISLSLSLFDGGPLSDAHRERETDDHIQPLVVAFVNGRNRRQFPSFPPVAVAGTSSRSSQCPGISTKPSVSAVKREGCEACRTFCALFTECGKEL
jgi:hypothetical protein